MSKPARVLVVEDEMTIAMMIEDMLEQLGHEPVAFASRLPQALQLAQSSAIDLAILDVNLDGQPSFPVAAMLRDRGIPFFFATGYGKDGIDPAFAEVRVLGKPFRLPDLAEAIEAVR